MNQLRPFQNLSPAEVKQHLDAGSIHLIDVREPDEIAIASIPGSELCPMSQADDWIDKLPRDRPLVIFCHHGGRSAQVATVLSQRGYTDVINMQGGIDAWSTSIDRSVPRY
ncbi:MAG: rhodanese-like domain-containing protein [Herpetosiphon sp.]